MHDKYGTPINVGDKVAIEAVVVVAQPVTEYCNLTLEIGTDLPQGPHNVRGTLTINSKQVERVHSLTEQEQDFLSQFFEYSHLPTHLQPISKWFHDTARRILYLPKNPERTVALRKLLEAKDCAVRAVIAK
ncbi:MAG TPA: hypothetical protein PLX39_15455 [Pyrinomonadaceae bacterium]|nr:hypothetical protein [Pyrinomonadaceae bacterium]